MEVISLIVTTLISFAVLVLPFGIASAVVNGVIASKKTDPVEKQKFKKIALWSFCGPLFFLLIILVVWGLVSTLNTTISG